MCVQFFFVSILASTSSAAESDLLAHSSIVSVTEHAAPGPVRGFIVEIESALGAPFYNSTDSSISEIESSLRASFKALPKNTMGTLDCSAAKYLLNRFFVQRHGWVIRGLQPDTSIDLANGSSMSRLLAGRAHIRVHDILQKEIGQEGWSFKLVVAIAALLEHLIGEETIGRLEQVYEVSDIATTDAINSTAAFALAELYMMFYIQGYYEDIHQFPRAKIKNIEMQFVISFPPWPKARQMLHQILQDVAPDSQAFRFSDVARAVREAVNQFYHRVQKDQCQHTKNLLNEIEDHGSGRVKLLDFYNRAIYDQKYQFTETIDFLRQNGALDESDSLVPRVIITNYVSGQSNCVARSPEHAVCCPDDCEVRFGELESKLGKPSAVPAEILDVQEHATTRGRMTPLLLKRLYEIADLHGGSIPIHGRLFRQWMHFVHPDACMYPYTTGSVYTKTMEEWETETGMRTGALTQEVDDWSKSLAALQSQRNAANEVAADFIGKWTTEKEVVAHDYEPLTSVTRRAANARVIVSIIMSVGVFSSSIHRS